MSVYTANSPGDWSIVREPAREAPSAVFDMECTTCGHSSGATEEPEAVREWAARHVAGSPTHTGFREVVHRFWRAFPSG
ncbi:hypothetical protein ABZW18_10125 [Streptomyces sp. NPDC004647]|uniref:DUF7848 domain-containing protein n=1 Tax=Streptomyces sp. NPDC004647 TaxID=3154671 RepID=UPI0033A36FF0